MKRVTKWQIAKGHRRNGLMGNTMPERIENLKERLRPIEFYLDELSEWTPRPECGWTDGGLCPFHDDKRPGSFKVNLDSGAFKCFSCDTRGGDIVAFYQKRYFCNFGTALLDLERRVGLW